MGNPIHETSLYKILKPIECKSPWFINWTYNLTVDMIDGVTLGRAGFCDAIVVINAYVGIYNYMAWFQQGRIFGTIVLLNLGQAYIITVEGCGL
jgi:hypothetical protein